MSVNFNSKDGRLMQALQAVPKDECGTIDAGAVSTQYGVQFPEHANEFDTAAEAAAGLERLSKENPALVGFRYVLTQAGVNWPES